MARTLRPLPHRHNPLVPTLAKPPTPPPPIEPLAKGFAQSFNPQNRSPLFTTLPPELRNRIFNLVLTEHDDLNSPVPFDSCGFRPEHAFRHTHAIELLRTCRRVYLETYLIPSTTTSHVVWSCWNERAPFENATTPRFNEMTPEQRAAAHTLRFYAQQCELEGGNWAGVAGLLPDVRIRHLVITIRHTDWWSWENDATLRLDPVGRYGNMWREELARAFPALEVFEMELETLERRRAEMDVLAAQVRQWRIEVGDGRVLSTEGEAVKTRTWVGTSENCGALPPPEGATTLPYYIATVLWRVQAAADVAKA